MNILAAVEAYARAAHQGQRRKYADEEYIRHPVRVMEMCRTYTDDESILEAALLHDVLEDTEVTAESLYRFLLLLHPGPQAVRVLKLVRELTDEYTSADYPAWNRAKRKELECLRLSKVSSEAQTIKYADIIDNSRDIANSGSDFAPRYLREARDMLQNLRKGNNELHSMATAIVDEELNRISNLVKKNHSESI